MLLTAPPALWDLLALLLLFFLGLLRRLYYTNSFKLSAENNYYRTITRLSLVCNSASINGLTYITLNSYAHARIPRCCQKLVQVLQHAFIRTRGETLCRIDLTKKIGLFPKELRAVASLISYRILFHSMGPYFEETTVN